jgi:hypothetical protein
MKQFGLIKILLPAGSMLSGMFGTGIKDKFEKWIIKTNNITVAKQVFDKHKTILVLLPHCLQNDDCKHRIVKDINNCAACKKCDIYEIVRLGKKFGLTIKVATGGRLAQRIVKETKPGLILAVACEHELSDGLYAVYPMKVYGIPNTRPDGPCVNTRVDIKLIENILNQTVRSTNG